MKAVVETRYFGTVILSEDSKRAARSGTWLTASPYVQGTRRKVILNRTRSRSDKRPSRVNRSSFLCLIPQESPSSALACIIYIVRCQAPSFDRGSFDARSRRRGRAIQGKIGSTKFHPPSATSTGEIFNLPTCSRILIKNLRVRRVPAAP